MIEPEHSVVTAARDEQRSAAHYFDWDSYDPNWSYVPEPEDER